MQRNQKTFEYYDKASLSTVLRINLKTLNNVSHIYSQKVRKYQTARNCLNLISKVNNWERNETESKEPGFKEKEKNIIRQESDHYRSWMKMSFCWKMRMKVYENSYEGFSKMMWLNLWTWIVFWWCDRSVYNLLGKGVAIRNIETVRPVLKNLTNNKVCLLLLSKVEVGNILLEAENNTLHLDWTRKKFNEYVSFKVTTGEGSKFCQWVIKIYHQDVVMNMWKLQRTYSMK